MEPLRDVSQFMRYYVDARRIPYVVVDPGSLTDATAAVLVDYSVRGAGDFNYYHNTKTMHQKRIVRYDVVGARRLDASLSHVEQAAQIQAWLTEEKVTRWLGEDKPRFVLNTTMIGAPAARSFQALRPRWFQDGERKVDLSSLLLGKLNAGELHIADGISIAPDDMERVSDARAVAIAIWAAGGIMIRTEL
jgi:hypothetical protein